MRKVAERAQAEDAPDLSDWEKEFVDGVGKRLETYGSAFRDPSKGSLEEALSISTELGMKPLIDRVATLREQVELLRAAPEIAAAELTDLSLPADGGAAFSFLLTLYSKLLNGLAIFLCQASWEFYIIPFELCFNAPILIWFKSCNLFFSLYYHSNSNRLYSAR